MGLPVVEVCVVEAPQPLLVEAGLWFVGAADIVTEEVFVARLVCVLGLHEICLFRLLKTLTLTPLGQSRLKLCVAADVAAIWGKHLRYCLQVSPQQQGNKPPATGTADIVWSELQPTLFEQVFRLVAEAAILSGDQNVHQAVRSTISQLSPEHASV